MPPARTLARSLASSLLPRAGPAAPWAPCARLFGASLNPPRSTTLFTHELSGRIFPPRVSIPGIALTG